jgi:chromosome segregation ATPase
MSEIWGNDKTLSSSSLTKTAASSQFSEEDNVDAEAVEVNRIANAMAAALQSLEKDMLLANNEMDEREDYLAGLYLELEGCSGDLDPQEYDKRLDGLELQRRTLEEERKQLQVVVMQGAFT